MNYGDMHRFFLRTVASQGILSVSKAQDVLNKSFPEQFKTTIGDLIQEVNKKIKPFDQKIKIVYNDETSEENLVFLFIASDDAAKSQTIFSPQELEFFRKIMEEIMTTENRQIDSNYALNLVNNLKLTKTEAQKLLKMWCTMYYLVEKNTNYALGLRAIHEFEGYMLENMPDIIQKCCLCKDIVYQGYNCPFCDKAVHTRCLNAYGRAKWPCCKEDFDEAQLERYNQGSFEDMATPQPSTSRSSQAYHRSNSIEESLDVSQLQPSTSRTQILSMDTSDDEFEMTQGSTIPGISQRIGRKRKRPTRD
ncbi:uncharacterized protein LOC112042970 [Bicyclus anynana]|uniref:Non-structural maintenance of chromosomes element 1 homolog n=1 Tax=Bicyclus anynana TaxID=110368 RepID=A0ABM3LL92_BICAN|nr:uncharacterized protein LOC112042970 [Bicyclus anynana]